MLTIALEPYFDARVADIGICPITLSYEKTVEENLVKYGIYCSFAKLFHNNIMFI